MSAYVIANSVQNRQLDYLLKRLATGKITVLCFGQYSYVEKLQAGIRSAEIWFF
jgi:hypothetical protein